MTEDRARLRALLGASAALWAGSVEVTPGRWDALSGARSLEYNVVMCHGPGTVAPGREALLVNRRPGLLMVSGEASGEVQDLVEAGWTCVGAVPFMVRPLTGTEESQAPDHRRLAGDELGRARQLVAEVFDLGPELAEVAFGDRGVSAPGASAWGAFDPDGRLVSCLALVDVEGSACVWSMATARDARRQGHGARLLMTALAAAHEAGATRSLLHASPEGTPFYASLGYEELERWQLWSRPRWLFGRE